MRPRGVFGTSRQVCAAACVFLVCMAHTLTSPHVAQTCAVLLLLGWFVWTKYGRLDDPDRK